jgi:hypothetical protein
MTPEILLVMLVIVYLIGFAQGVLMANIYKR